MKKICTYIAPVLAACMVSSAPAFAQDEVQQAVQSDSFSQLYTTLIQGVDEDIILENLVRQVSEQVINSDPNIAAMEAENPGLLLEMMLALRPVLGQYRQRVLAQYTPQFVGVLREILTEEEAQQLAEFYRSESGRLLLTSVSENVVSGQVVDQALSEQEITSQAVAADEAQTITRSVGALSQAQREQINADLSSIPGIYKLTDFAARTRPFRVAMENEPPTAEEEQMIEDGVARAFDKYFEREHN